MAEIDWSKEERRELWTEKHRPKTLDDIVGNKGSMRAQQLFMQNV